jgi:anti-anti-sigma factor
MPLEMTFSVQGKTARLNLAGELDGNSAPAVRQAVETVLSGAPERLVMAVEKLNFMASAGLRILIFAKQKQPNLRIYLIKPQDAVVDTLKKTGFYQSVYIMDDESGEAQASVQA